MVAIAPDLWNIQTPLCPPFPPRASPVYFLKEPIDELITLMPHRSSINVWIGQPGVAAHAHYDGYHNFYAQLVGRKRFVLFPPQAWDALGVYPFLHPCHAQSRTNFSTADSATASGTATTITATASHPPESTNRNGERGGGGGVGGEGGSMDTAVDAVDAVDAVGAVDAVDARRAIAEHAGGYAVVLNPGDVLYLPPLWFHYVEALDTSVSVNVWTDTEQTAVAERLFGVEWPSVPYPPFPRNIVSRRMQGEWEVREVLKEVFRATSKMTGDGYAARLLNARYAADANGGGSGGQCMFSTEEAASLLEHAADEARPKPATPAAPATEGARMWWDAVERFAATVAGIGREFPEDTAGVWLGNWVEAVIAQQLGVHAVPRLLAAAAVPKSSCA